MALALQVLDPVGDRARLFLAVPHAGEGELVAAFCSRPQGLAEAAVVAGDQVGRGGEDRRGRAIVLLQPDHRRAGKIFLETQDVLDLGAAPTVDRLVVVADAADVAVLLRQQPQPEILGDVGILILVDQDVAEPVVILRQNVVVLHQDRQIVQQQVAEIDGVEAPEPVLVGGVEFGRPAAGEIARIGGGDLFRSLALVLPALDHPVQQPRRPALGIDVGGFQFLLDEAELVVRVENREVRFQADKLGMAAQDARGERVEGAEPDFLRRLRPEQGRDQPADPLAHFPRRPVGEGDGENLPRHGAPGREDMGDADCQRPGLAGARTGQDQHCAPGLFHRLALLVVQAVQPCRIVRRGRGDGSASGQRERVGGRFGHRPAEYRPGQTGGLSGSRDRRRRNPGRVQDAPCSANGLAWVSFSTNHIARPAA